MVNSSLASWDQIRSDLINGKLLAKGNSQVNDLAEPRHWGSNNGRETIKLLLLNAFFSTKDNEKCLIYGNLSQIIKRQITQL